MAGVVGGYLDAKRCASGTPVYGRAKEICEHYINNDIEIFVRWPAKDKGSIQSIEVGSKYVCVFGAISEQVDEKLLSHFFDRPEECLTEIDGTFIIIGTNTDEKRIIIGTDKLGSHPCYFVPSSPVFSTSVAACLPHTSKGPDEQAIADFLLLGHLWGARTLVSEVKSMRPSFIYEYRGGDWTKTRYWKPSYKERTPGRDYIEELSERFRSAIIETTKRTPNEVGIWLSGGLDSRATATIASTTDISLRGYSYNANPPTGDNTKIARRVGKRLNIPVSEIPLDEENTGPERIERLIDVCDGMVRWNTTLNLSPSYDVSEPVLLEGVEGSLMGDHLLRSHFTDYSDPVESLIASEAAHSIDTVNNLLKIDADPTQTLRSEVEQTDEDEFRRQILDIHFQNYYNRHALASNAVIRDVSGDRVAYVDRDYLEWCAGLPIKYRKGTVPGFNSIPTGTSRAKLALARHIGGDVAWVTYERTKIPPILPYHLHIFGFFTNIVINRVRQRPTYGSGQLADFWLRNNGEISDWARDQLQSAANRYLFDNKLMNLWDRHQEGENLSSLITQITTLEYWLNKRLDL